MFAPDYSLSVKYPNAQFNPGEGYPGHTIMSVGASQQNIRGLMWGYGVMAFGSLIGTVILGLLLPLKYMQKNKDLKGIPWWGKGLITFFVTMPLGGMLGAIPGFAMIGSNVMSIAKQEKQATQAERAQRQQRMNAFRDSLGQIARNLQ